MSNITFCIAVIDDDQEDLLLFKRALCETKVQAKLLVAANSIELIGILTKESIVPHLIFLNIHLLLRDGLSMVTHLHTDSYKTVPKIVLSTLEDLQTINQAYKGGATLVLRKPSQYSDYLHILNSLLKENYNWLSHLMSLPDKRA